MNTLNNIKSIDELLASINHLEAEKRIYSNRLSEKEIKEIDETISDLRKVLREFLKISAKLLINQIISCNDSITKEQIDNIAKEQIALPEKSNNELPAVLNVSKDDLKKKISPLLKSGNKNEALEEAIRWMTSNNADTSHRGNCWKFLNQLINEIQDENKLPYTETDLVKLYKLLEEGDRKSAIDLFTPLLRSTEPELSGKRIRMKIMEIYQKIKGDDNYRYELIMLNKELNR